MEQKTMSLVKEEIQNELKDDSEDEKDTQHFDEETNQNEAKQ